MLQARDPESGLRDIDAVVKLAAGVGLTLTHDHDLPAFNHLLVFNKKAGRERPVPYEAARGV